MSRKAPVSSRAPSNPRGLGRPSTNGLARTGLGEPAAGNVERWKAPFKKSGSVNISSDRVGFLTDPEGPGRTNFQVDPGDVIRARVNVSTSGNIKTRLMLTPSKGDGPIYDKGVVTKWVQGQNIPLQASITVPDGMSWMSVALDQPNWTPEQIPEDSNYPFEFTGEQMTGTISWQNAKITVNRPLDGGGTLLGGFSATDALIGGGALVGATVLFVSLSN